MLRRTLTALLLAAVASGPALAVPAPRVTLPSYDRLKTPLPSPYDEAADAASQVAAARARARREGKLLLLDFGGNWCPDCRILAATIDQTELKRFVGDRFELVMVDIGGKDRGKNGAVAARYGLKVEGVPALVVVDPKNGRVLNRSHVADLSDARHMSPQGLADYIARWAR